MSEAEKPVTEKAPAKKKETSKAPAQPKKQEDKSDVTEELHPKFHKFT